MAYRAPYETTSDSLKSWMKEVELRLRQLEERANPMPDPGWVLQEDDAGLRVLYVPSGSLGPVIGTR